jgi:hypothetical protein
MKLGIMITIALIPMVITQAMMMSIMIKGELWAKFKRPLLKNKISLIY